MRYQLTNKESQLLELLMANPGQVISSDQIGRASCRERV